MNQKQKLKMKLIVKTYLIINNQATLPELVDFINTYFNNWQGVSLMELAKIINNDKYHGHVLDKLEIIKKKNSYKGVRTIYKWRN